MTTTPIYGLNEIITAQKGKNITHNEAIRWLEALTSRVLSRTTDAQPGAPTDGDMYIMTASASGADWAGRSAGDLALYLGTAWDFLAPVEGMSNIWVNDEDLAVSYSGSAWAGFMSAGTSTGSFTNATLTAGVLSYTHDLGTKFVTPTIYDNNDIKQEPDKVTGTSTSIVSVDLSSYGAIAGTWNIRVTG